MDTVLLHEALKFEKFSKIDNYEHIEKEKIEPDNLVGLLNSIERLVHEEGCISNPVYYQNLCKLAADICFQKDQVLDGIFFLSESHGVSQRKMCFEKQAIDKFLDEKNSSKNSSRLLNAMYLSTNLNERYNGLQRRLKEMPEEWTIVQITLPFHRHGRWEIDKQCSQRIKGVHIVRSKCGNETLLSSSCHIYSPFRTEETECNILNKLYNSILNKSLHQRRDFKFVKERRMRNCEALKDLVEEEIYSDLLQCWRFLLLGRICNNRLEKKLIKLIRDYMDKESIGLSSNAKNVIEQLIFGCMHLDEGEIREVLEYFVEERKLRDNLIDHIIRIRSEHSNLMTEKRYPVILVLDEKIECLPWEMLSVLKNHPASRMFSVHFCHALYMANKESIVHGNKMVTDISKGYYVINPDLNLPDTEKDMKNFLNEKGIKWQGLIGRAPTKDEFYNALKECSLYLYCGHGSGAQYLTCTRLECGLKAIPLLFGCSSIQHFEVGGRVPFACHADSFILSGSPCVLGMLWNVTSKDIDEVAMKLISYWLPGNPVELQLSKRNISKKQEPELLRAVISAKDAALLYSNQCAMVVYGIPVKVQ